MNFGQKLRKFKEAKGITQQGLAEKLGYVNINYISDELGAAIYEILTTKKIKEVYFPDLKAIVIKPDLPPSEKNYLIAHALGHHLFHQIGLTQDYISLHEEGSFKSLEIGRNEIARKGS